MSDIESCTPEGAGVRGTEAPKTGGVIKTRFKCFSTSVVIPIVAFAKDRPDTEVYQTVCEWRFKPYIERTPFDSPYEDYEYIERTRYFKPEDFNDLVDGAVAFQLYDVYMVGKKKYRSSGFGIVIPVKVRERDIGKKGREEYDKRPIATSSDGEKIYRVSVAEWEVLPYYP